MAADGIVLPHILDRDLDAVLLGKRGQAAVELDVEIKDLLFVSVIAPRLQRMYDHLLHAEIRDDLENAPELGLEDPDEFLVAEGSVRLIEHDAEAFGDLFRFFLILFGGQFLELVDIQREIERGIARFTEQFDPLREPEHLRRTLRLGCK